MNGPPPIDIDPAMIFALLDRELPLALFPVRLEARFLPDVDPTEIVIRVFPDDIVVDTHDPSLTSGELALARTFWETIWRAAADPAVVSESRAWLAAELGANRAIYVAAATQPDTAPPARPTKPGAPLVPPLVLRKTMPREGASPGKARLLPERWAAFVQVGDDRRGPFWASHRVSEELTAAPALVDIPEAADARTFLDAQGLGWTHDLAAAEQAGMVIRVPIAGLPPRPPEGYDRLIVIGASAESDHQQALKRLLDAHRYTRGLDFLPPGTATNLTEESPDGAGETPIESMFDRELASGPDPAGTKPDPVRTLAPPEALFSASAADRLAVAFGLPGTTAADRASAAADDSASLAVAANRALWPATLGRYLSDPMRWADTSRPLLQRDDTAFLRNWFTDYVRADGPLPTLRVGRQPYGLLPVRAIAHRDPSGQVDHLENFLFDLFGMWFNADGPPRLDPDSADTRPRDDVAAEKASEIGTIYGATPHLHEIRLRAVDDTYRDLTDLYSLRVGVLGLLCALVPNRDGTLPESEQLETHAWYQIFKRYEGDIRGARGVQAQLDAMRAMVDDLYAASGSIPQEIGAFRAIKYIDKYETHGEPVGGDWPPEESFLTGDLLGMAGRHHARVLDAQPYLGALGAEDHLGAEHAPRMYTSAYDVDGGEVPVGPVVSALAGDAAVAEVTAWLTEIRDAVRAWEGAGPNGVPPSFDATAPAPLLRQLLQSAAADVTSGPAATSLRQGLGALLRLVRSRGEAGIAELDRLTRATLGLSMYRVDAWVTSLASARLAEARAKRPAGLQVGGFGWLVNLKPRSGRVSQGFIHASSLDHAVTAAVLRSGWNAFGTGGAGSPLAVNLSSERIRAARSLIEGVRSGQELGRLLGARFERRLHDRFLDRHIDDIRAAVISGAGTPGRPTSRIVDGLLLARGFTEGIERTDAERHVAEAVEPVLAAAGDDEAALRRAVQDTVGDLDAVADVLTSQAVHGLLRGDAGVAAPTLAATGSGDSGLPAIDFPNTQRGGRQVTLRVVALFGRDLPSGDDVIAWPAAPTSPLALAEPRLETWAGQLLGSPRDVVIEFAVGASRDRRTLDTFKLGALDIVYGVDRLGDMLVEQSGIGGATIVPGRPDGIPEASIGFDELVTLARSLRDAFGRVRAVTDTDFSRDAAVPTSWDAADLGARLATVRATVPEGDARLAQLAAHEAEHPGATAALLVDRLRILTVHPMPILPLLADGVPEPVRQSFGRRDAAAARNAGIAWLTQAGKTRPGVRDAMLAVELCELARDRAIVGCALAQTPDAQGRPWVGTDAPHGDGLHVGWCCVTGAPSAGPIAGLVIDSWTETVPDTKMSTGIAIHFDKPSATAPNAVLLVLTRSGEPFSLDYVAGCLDTTLRLAQFRAMGADDERLFLSQYLPAVFLPGEAAVIEADADLDAGPVGVPGGRS